MNTGINVACGVSPESIEAATTGILLVLQAGFENHADQETIRFALGVLEKASKAGNTTIQGCNLSDDNVVRMGKEG